MRSTFAFTAAAAAMSFSSVVSAYTTVQDPHHPPHTTESGQYGYNDCYNKPDSKSSKCQTLVINSLDDFCLYAPPERQTIGESERYEVAWCSRGHGARLMPSGTITGAHFVKTKDYVQITGTGDFTKMNIPAGDSGGELDPHGSDGKGNPIGAVVVGNGKESGSFIQFKEWTQFISDTEFCIRACFDGPESKSLCNHIYDTEGCWWNMPANYNSGEFESCDGQSDEPMGVYKQKDGSKSTFYHGQAHTPAPHSAAPSSNCRSQQTIAPASYPTSKKKARRQPHH